MFSFGGLTIGYVLWNGEDTKILETAILMSFVRLAMLSALMFLEPFGRMPIYKGVNRGQ